MKTDVLLKPFPPEQIKTRLGPKGKQVQYIPAAYVIERLNAATEHTWGFEIAKYEIRGEEIVVLGKLTLDGIVKMDVGTVAITRDAAGDAVSVGDDIKACVSDAIKRCARLFGVGLHLYMNNNTPGGSPPVRAEERLTSRQLSTIESAARRQGWSAQDIAGLLHQRFGKDTPHALTRSEASSIISELSGPSLNGH